MTQVKLPNAKPLWQSVFVLPGCFSVYLEVSHTHTHTLMLLRNIYFFIFVVVCCMTVEGQNKANVIHINEGNHGLLIRNRDVRVSGNPVKKSILLFSNCFFYFPFYTNVNLAVKHK